MPKRASIHFKASREFEGLKLKFGGEPFGLPKSLWPLSSSTGEPLQFICQIPFGPDLFPGASDAMAYLFMNASGEAETWQPDGGENAVVILPVERLTSVFAVGDAPRLYRMVKKWWKKCREPESIVFACTLQLSEDPVFVPEEAQLRMEEPDRLAYLEALEGNKLGGSPLFIQSDELPFSKPWHLLLQLDSANTPFWINFGDAGIGHLFINGNGTVGKFLWQCC